MFTQPFDDTRIFSYGVSYYRIPDADVKRLSLSDLKDDSDRTGKLCQDLAKMCFPVENEMDDISLTHHYSSAAPQYDRRPWVARLESHENATTASYLGIFHLKSAHDEKRWNDEFWIGVQCGAPHASRDLMDEVRKTCAGDAPTLLMNDFVNSSQAKFVARAGFRTRSRLLANAWKILLETSNCEDYGDEWGTEDSASVYFRNRYDMRWPCVGAVLREDGNEEGDDEDWDGEIERLLLPTIEYGTHNIEVHVGAGKNECIYYSNAFNAKRAIEERGRGSVIVSNTPSLGSALIQYEEGQYNEDELLPRWSYPYAFPAAPGVTNEFQQTLRFEKQTITIPERNLRLFDKNSRVGTAYMNNIFFGFPVTFGSTWPSRILNHRITLGSYYRSRKRLNMDKCEVRMGLPLRGVTESALMPIICIVPGTHPDRILN